MTDPYLYTVSNNVATFSINDAPWNLMSLAYIDRLKEQLPEVLADDHIRAIVFTGEGLDHFSEKWVELLVDPSTTFRTSGLHLAFMHS